MNIFDGCKWVWKNDCIGENTYVDFEESFTAEGGDYTLYISADSDYAVYINGSFVDAGQYKAYDFYRFYDTLDVSKYIKSGENTLLITGYSQGLDSSCCRKEPCGVIYSLCKGENTVLCSGAKTKARKNPYYISDNCPLVSGQLGFSANYDSRAKETPFTAADVQPISTNSLHPRPIKKLVTHENLKGRLLAQGIFKKKQDEPIKFGHEMLYAWESFRDGYLIREPNEYIQYLPGDVSLVTNEECDGVYFVVDYLQENTGFLSLDIELDEDALVLIGYSEHTEDMRVRSAVGSANYSMRYYAKKGRNVFMHPFRRMGMRYMEFHVYSKKVKVHYAGMRPTLYPLESSVGYDCHDFLHNKIYEVYKRTLHMCMHEHYEDCPMREQSQYTMDSRNQMLTGYYVFKETAFAKASLRLMALSIREDDMLELCSPARVGITIPSFSAIFLTAAAEYLSFTGDKAFVEEILPVLERIAQKFVSRTEQNGLIRRFKEAEYWNFYEWQPRLDGQIGHECSDDEWTYDAPLNAFVSMAFSSLSEIYNTLGNSEKHKLYKELHESLNGKINSIFWDEKQQAYASFMLNNQISHYAQLTQALIAYCGAAPKERHDEILEKLCKNELVEITPSHAIFKYEALLSNPKKYKQFVFDDIARVWGNMLYNGATTFWETNDGASAFGNAGSLCHGWSATPAYLYMKYKVNE